MPLLGFSFFVGNFLAVTTDVRPLWGREVGMMRYPQVTSLRSDYPRLLLRVASPMPLLGFSLYLGNFLVVTTDVRPLWGRGGSEDVLSAGNLPVVGLPAVTTKVCPLWGLKKTLA